MVSIGSQFSSADLDVTGTLTQGGSAVQTAIPGFSLSPQIILGPTNNPTIQYGAAGWVVHSSGAYATLNVGTANPYDSFISISGGLTFLANQTATVSCEIMLPASNAASNFCLHYNGGGTFVPSPQGQAFSGFSTTSWTPCSFSTTTMLTGTGEIMFGKHHLNTAITQSTGQVLIRNVKVTTTPSAYTFANAMTIGGNLSVTGNVTATGTVSGSDRSIKTDVETLSTEAALSMLKNVEAKVYERTDIGRTDKRIGFIANDVKDSCPDEWGNLVSTVNAKDGQILGLDYARFCPILWTICRTQQELIKDLSTRVQALDSPKTKTKTTAKAKK